MIGPVAWQQWQSAADELFAGDARGFWRDTAFSQMDEDALDTTTAVAPALPGRGTSVDIHHLGGAFSRVPAQSTAFPNRAARFWMIINGYWREPGEDARFTAFAERAEAAMTRLGEQGEYVNFRAREFTGPLADLTRRVHGEQTYRRLRQVKRHYDSGNLFRVNYNVAP